jgi:IS30 family transposase
MHACIRADGGLEPPARKRSPRVLSTADREEISRGLTLRLSLREIARRIGRAASTLSREVRRNGGVSTYRGHRADRRAWSRARRPQRCRLAKNRRLRDAVAAKLTLQWAPQQISAWLVREYPDEDSMRVSHETIYRTLFVQARGALKQQLLEHLRSGRTIRRPRAAGSRSRESKIRDPVQIRERPAEVEDRAVPGHWEGDLLLGKDQSQIATLVERHTRYVMLIKMPRKDTVTVTAALARHMAKLPAHLRRSLTWDRGTELAAHREFTLETKIQVYFCDPRSPWQRGSNENTNGLLRQYFPKNSDLSQHSQAYLNKIAVRLNQRPRQTLGWDNPAKRLAACVAPTG